MTESGSTGQPEEPERPLEPPPGDGAPQADDSPEDRGASQHDGWAQTDVVPTPPGSPEDDALGPSPAGPPGGAIFSLEGRKAPGLYLVAWVFSVGGTALLFLSMLASSSLGRLVFVGIGAVALLLGLAAAAGSQIMERSERTPDRYRGPSPLLVFGVFLAGTTIIAAVVSSLGIVDLQSPLGFLTSLLLLAGGYLTATWLFVVKSGALSWADMGWPSRGTTTARDVLRGVGFSVAVMLPVTIGALILAGILAWMLGVEAPGVLPTPSNSVEALAVAIGAAVIAPVAEELFFRGFALTAWLKDLGARAAIIRSALFFALIHIVNITTNDFGEGASQAMLQTAVFIPLGAVFGWLFLRRGMVGAISGHVTYNSLLLFLWLLSAYLPETAV